MSLDVDPGKKQTNAHTTEEVAQVVPRKIVSDDPLSEGEPGSLPGYLFALLHLLRSSVWHRNQRPVDLERLGKLVEHLLVIVKGHLAIDELVHPRLQLRGIVAQLLQERVVLRWDVIRMADGRRNLRWDMCRNTELITWHHVILEFQICVPAGLVVNVRPHYWPARVDCSVETRRALVQLSLLQHHRAQRRQAAGCTKAGGKCLHGLHLRRKAPSAACNHRHGSREP
mmetsp:Transcript_51125/g.119827  ORF Transcript_51125/g.119827 Transcript_51125/m.119827 type:complete len:227 (-) Transcript_51125:33-713(-)